MYIAVLDTNANNVDLISIDDIHLKEEPTGEYIESILSSVGYDTENICWMCSNKPFDIRKIVISPKGKEKPKGLKKTPENYS